MLREDEKKTVCYLWKCGRSYQEIAHELLMWRSHYVFNNLCMAVEAYIKEEDL